MSPDTLNQLLEEVMAGMSATPRCLPTRLLYDARGSALFKQICRLDNYYLTRSEHNILDNHSEAIAKALGPQILLIEYGAGDFSKTRKLLDRLESPAGYVPIDVAENLLHSSAVELRTQYPSLNVLPVVADFTKSISLNGVMPNASRRAVYLAGSTIGNCEESFAVHLLRQMKATVGDGGAVLVGFDLVKRRDLLVRAYNDPEGITAAFSLNSLRHANSLVGTNFDLDAFESRAIYNDERARIEMQLISKCRQTVDLAEHKFVLDEGEKIISEYSHKYSPQAFAELARASGLRPVEHWHDEAGWFRIQYLTA